MNLQNASLFCQKNLIAGEWVDADSGETIDVDNPSTLAVVGAVPSCGVNEPHRFINVPNGYCRPWTVGLENRCSSRADNNQKYLFW